MSLFFAKLPSDFALGVSGPRIAMAAKLFLVFEVVDADHNAVDFEVKSLNCGL